jgi:hypothetical protein
LKANLLILVVDEEDGDGENSSIMDEKRWKKCHPRMMN